MKNLPDGRTIGGGDATTYIAQWFHGTEETFAANAVTQVDFVQNGPYDIPPGEPNSNAVAGWVATSPDVGLIVVGAQLDALGTGLRVFILNYTAVPIDAGFLIVSATYRGLIT